jgi:hypothetical protein
MPPQVTENPESHSTVYAEWSDLRYDFTVGEDGIQICGIQKQVRVIPNVMHCQLCAQNIQFITVYSAVFRFGQFIADLILVYSHICYEIVRKLHIKTDTVILDRVYVLIPVSLSSHFNYDSLNGTSVTDQSLLDIQG